MMDDMIYRGKLLEQFHNHYAARNTETNAIMDEVRMMLIKAPNVDAVEVVRCKDCVSHNFCKFEQYLGLDGFCSYGGRKEDETD